MISTRAPTNLAVSNIATDIARQQNALTQYQEQISSGKQVNRPSDAPAESAHLLTMEQTQGALAQFDENGSLAQSQLALEEGAIAASTDTLNRIRELAIRANSGTFEGDDREVITQEISLALEELYSLANSQDSFGNYLFSGTNKETQPFYNGYPGEYSGNDDSSEVEIATGRSITTGNSGIDVFMRIRNGNGDFVTSENSTNTGTGRVSEGQVADYTEFDGGDYDITFTSPTTFDVTERGSGSVVLSSQTYKSGSEINVGGMALTISGDPDTGDIFALEPSVNQDVFSSVSNLIDALSSKPTTDAGRAINASDLQRSQGQLDNALDHLNTIRSSVGSRLNSIDISREENENLNLQLERTTSEIEDVDIADVVTRLQSQANSLEILQKSYTRIEGLSLFDFM